MINKAPIFINGFSFGGTNLIMNLFVSHPDVCMLSGETHEVFASKPRKVLDKYVREFFYLPVRAAARQDVMGKACFEERHTLPPLVMRYIDLIFYVDKITTGRNDFKDEGVPYTRDEVGRARFLAKSVNGVVFATDVFARMYPDATHVALVRDGFALCEGYKRRGWSAREFAAMYARVCSKMLADEKRYDNYHIARFEDMVADPVGFTKKMYSLAGLDIGRLARVRLQAKRTMDSSGARRYTFGGDKDREIRWFSLDEVPAYIRGDVNRNQASNLTDEDKRDVLAAAGPVMETLGYSGGGGETFPMREHGRT